MALTTGELSVVRSYVGPRPTEEDLNDRFDRLGSFDRLVEEVLRSQIARLASQPSSFTVPGLSISNGNLLAELRKTLKDFLNGSGTGLDEASSSTLGAYPLRRPDYR